MVFTLERLSVALRLTVTLWLFHPAGALALVTGAVRSILTAGLLVALVELPALSLTEALAVRPTPSPVIVLSAGLVEGSMPDRASAAVHSIVTSPLYHPSPLGLEVGVPLKVGALLSMLMLLTVALALLPATSDAVPVTTWFSPSLLTVVGPGQPPTAAMPERESLQTKLTTTSLLFHP